MYLKEITTNGFKSFAEKMTISLDGKTTCIVGPNGSGKSNVVDAIRWVLGEQSVKSLRGEGSMSDVIFAGSDSRKAKNAASVELVFDNSDHYLNLEYSEVSIKRRVFRGGENEYYINQEKCRLKDIINLFLDSGIGRESFNIISQGEVQKILSDSKEDRRAIFEEAAGILKYKKRKEEALRKLDKTHISLDRVEDIILELESQVIPLKEQSEKAKEYLENKENLENLEISLLAYDIYTLDNEKKQLEEKKNFLEQEVEKLKSDQALDGTDEIKLKNEQHRIEEELQRSQTALLKVTEEVASLQGELTLLRAQKRSNDSNAKQEEILSIREEKAEKAKKLTLLDETINSFKETSLNKKNMMDDLQQSLNGLKLERKQLEYAYSKLDRDILTAEHKRELLKQEEEKNSNLPMMIRSILQNKMLNGIYDIIGNVVKTKNEYTRALDIAISSSRNFVIVKDEICASDAISYLKQQKLGRATFFPINVIQARYIDEMTKLSLKSVEGYIGILADLVDCAERYRNIIYNQLGQVIVAQDMDSALAISQMIHKKYRVITLAGDVIHVGGSMSGGSMYHGRSSIMIAQEISTLTANIDNYVFEKESTLKKLTDYKEKIEKLEEEIFHIVKELQNITDTLQEKEKESKQLENDLNTLAGQLDNLESDDTKLDEKEAIFIETFYQKSAKKEKLELQLSSLQSSLIEIKDKLEEKLLDSRHKNSILRQTEEEKNKLELRLSKIDVKLDTMLNTLSSEYSMTYERARNDYQLELAVEEARVKVNYYKNNIRQIGMVNLAAIEEYERVSSRYEFLLQQKEDLEKAQSTLLEIMDEMDAVMKQEFLKTFEMIRLEFQQVFKELFCGGHADLELTNKEDLLTTGINIVASPPGKKLSMISLLSGGEKTLTAISLLFAILNVRVVPFCVFDEVEAALDEANVDQFGKYLAHYKDKTQFLIITHKKKTMEYADTLYGITMQESGVSKLVSVNLASKTELL